MANWELFRSSAKRIAKSAMKGTGEAADLAALHLRLKGLEKKRNSEYETLGRLTYRQLKTGISQAEKIAPVIKNIDAVREKMAAVNEDIEEVRRAREERLAKERAKKLELDEHEEMLNDIVEEANSDDEDEE